MVAEEDAVNHIYAVWILDENGDRLATRYAAMTKEFFPDYKAQRAFEAKVMSKVGKQSTPIKVEPPPTDAGEQDGVTLKMSRPGIRGDSKEEAESDIVVVDDYLVLYKGINDIYVCVVAPETENEIIMLMLLDGIFDSLRHVADGKSLISVGLSKRTVLESLEYVILILDEAQDDGIIMEVDADSIIERVKMHVNIRNSSSSAIAMPSSADAMAQVKQATEGPAKKLFNTWWGGASK